MRAFNNDSELQDRYVDRATAHERAGDYAQDFGYWKHGKGNPSGCLTHINLNAPLQLEKMGIPQSLTYLSDQIFEYLPPGEYQKWTRKYLSAMKTGVNLEPAAHYFLVWLLTEEIPKRFDTVKYVELYRACNHIAKLHWRTLGETEEVSKEAWERATKLASDITKTLSYAAAYADTKDTLAAARVSYVVNYSARTMALPNSALMVITAAHKSGVDTSHMAEILIRVIKGLGHDAWRAAPLTVEDIPMHKFLELLK